MAVEELLYLWRSTEESPGATVNDFCMIHKRPLKRFISYLAARQSGSLSCSKEQGAVVQ
jgi:hypothetical protein